MLDQDQLLERTESYLKAIFVDAMPSLSREFDSVTPFGELGIDSFRVLKVIRELESVFGILPKTLLFERFNIDELARYFVEEHAETVGKRFSGGTSGIGSDVGVPCEGASRTEVVNGGAEPRRDEPPVTAIRESRQTAGSRRDSAGQPLRLLEEDLERFPELQSVVRELFRRYKNEGGVSRGTRNIAPNLFIGGTRRGYFNYCRSGNLVLVYAYTGPEDYFTEIAGEMGDYCSQNGFQLNVFTDAAIDSIGATQFSATPFGALQRVLKLQEFTLTGSRMRRLRYQVSRFEKQGKCRTEEYRCGTSRKTDADIASIIDLWCESKPMVNPLVHVVKEEIIAGTLAVEHRIFLTYLDDVLQNVILVTELCPELNGYLMDLEFYPKDMPVGGLEYAIINIIGQLAEEGRDMLSLGGTYGVRLESSPNADPEIERILDDLHKQGIFNDDGNLQFKNKFRPENRSIYLCRPVGSGRADNLLDIVMMIADPAKAQTSDVENHNVVVEQGVGAGSESANSQSAMEGEPRFRTLAQHGFNPLNIPADHVEFDLKTDSWAQINASFVNRHMARLRSQLQQPVSVNDSLKSVFPFRHFVLTDAGRTAEHLLCSTWPKKGMVLENLLFPTGIYHQIDKGFSPQELPHSSLFLPGSADSCKAELNWNDFQNQLTTHGPEIAFVWIELSNNAAGGLPVSMHHLRRVRESLTEHSVPLVIDCTRVLENAQFLIENDSEYANKTVWDVSRDILGCADIVIGSLAKDFCIDKGGLVATNDESLVRRMSDRLEREGGGIDVIEKKLLALSLHNKRQIERQVRRRMHATAGVWQALKSAKVPVAEPVGGHCVLIDVKQIPEFAALQEPVASFLAWLYLGTGIRAGAHSVGMQKDTLLNGQVRLAIPVGMKQEAVETIVDRLVGLFRHRQNIPELTPVGSPSALGDVHADYELVRFHGLAKPVAAISPSAGAPTAVPPSATVARKQAPASVPATAPERKQNSRMEIAVVGMAGRYPGARDMEEFWNNLRQGADCIGDLPPERRAQRGNGPFGQSYRGGFIGDIDKFDSLFFNISPREAEMLDPQERLFLEVAWETLEDAGYYPEILGADDGSRDVGVFVGAVWAMYQILGVEGKLTGKDTNANSFLWSIANRVSYWMNLTGPSLTLDTACSSSLTALHLACESIRNGRCSSAIVGGVNLDLHQHKFDVNSAGGALSSDGVCRSFGAGANGYVAGEGVGAVFLKPLARALEDSDQIYGVIRSAVVNHGGRTSGYTVPNPQAQGKLIAAALEQAGVDARTLGYVEAHGTGTELGDPVEISGLSKAFKAYEVDNQSCSIGSVKTNIGHLEAAAGVAGLSKVLLQMKHRQLTPSLHSGELNEHIDFCNSPFYVQQQLEPWQARKISDTLFPLRAGISSFGAGGANAHVVVEEFERTRIESPAQPEVLVFPLSARTEDQLRRMATRLRDHLSRQDEASQPLRDVAFTLQYGRKSFDHRLALVAASYRELIEALGLFLDGIQDQKVLAGHAQNSEGVTALLNRGEREEFVKLLSRGRDPYKLARLWIDGLLSDCRGFVESGQRLSLPTYPFADKRHWIGSTGAAAGAVRGGAGIHPLIDSNESTFERQLFKKTFHASEFILRDHIVSGVKTLPGMAYLDLARKAGEIAAGRKVRKIRNVTWITPLALEERDVVHAFVELKPGGSSIIFEVFSESDGGGRQVYCQGSLLYAEEDSNEPRAEYIDLDGIRARCTAFSAGDQAYPKFEAAGLHYGPSFQVLQEIHNNQDEALGLLKLPAPLEADFDQFALHPCLLDASMQAGVVGQLDDPSGGMKVPYSLGEVELLHPLPRTCYSYVTKAQGSRDTASVLSREDVTVADEDGRVLLRIRESVGVPLARVHAQPAPVQHEEPRSREEAFTELYYSHVWRESVAEERPTDVQRLLLFDRDDRLCRAYRARNVEVILVLPGDQFAERSGGDYVVSAQDKADYVRLFSALEQRQWVPEKICYAWPESAEPQDLQMLQKALDAGVYPFLYLCQAVIGLKLPGRCQIAYLYTSESGAPQPHNEAINGFVRSLRLENPRVDCKVLELSREAMDADGQVRATLGELHADNQHETTVRYRGNTRYVRTLEKQEPLASGPGYGLRQKGAYLITGGTGGLGLVFAEYLARECQARLILTGRSEASAETEARFEQLRDLGAEVLYVRADVSKAEDVQRLMHESRARFGAIHGVIHTAGVLRDSFLTKKTAEEMAAVFAPKIHGTFLLDEQSRDENLDFFISFSSLAAIGGNLGQCDYAFANHYMDSFAAAREALRKSGRRSGRTLSLNWSLWADGGMKLDEQTEILFRKNLGIRPLSKEVGLSAFAKSLHGTQSHTAVLEGVQAKIEQAWGLVKQDPAPPAQNVAAPAGSGGGSALTSTIIDQLSNMVMELLKLNADDLSLDSILLDLGFDSIGLATFANTINSKYDLELNPTLFFEYPSIRAIADYLAAEHQGEILKIHGGETQATASTRPAESVAEKIEFGAKKNWLGAGPSPVQTGNLSRERRFADEPIAIVGMAGVMPGSASLDDFWDNLKNARDLVTEIPRDRWIWEEYDGNPIKEVNKSNSRWGGFIQDVDKFDPLFFGITPREAEMMDPQQRVFLETVWSAIEDSGHKVSDLAGTRTGVFVGVSARDYVDVLAEHESSLDGFSASGNSHSILANRISFLLNLRGPSAPIDTACSSSLIALHRAIESIHTGSSDMAIVGGVQVMLTPVGHISLSSAGMLSPEGRCKTFDQNADGYVRGEGAGAIFIKPLSKAEEDGDPIHAIVRATAENHGGRVTMLTAPNPKAQTELLVEAYGKADIDPSTVGYIECHGTGTSLGDPIEIQALKQSFANLYSKHGISAAKAPHCGLSSVKTNIGHLEPAAGIASLLKVLLSIQHKHIPALLHFETVNPYIDLDGSPFYIADKTRPWDAVKGTDGAELPRRAGVSSFGWGGANAHVVLEESRRPERPPYEAGSPQLVMLSAKNTARLESYAARLLSHIENYDVALDDLAYTLQVGRDPLEERLGLVVDSIADLTQKLRAFITSDGAIEGCYRGRVNLYKKDEQGLTVLEPGDSKSIPESGMAAADLAHLAEAWVGGGEVDWRKLWEVASGEREPRRINLPTYPFARDRHWIAAKATGQDRSSGRAAAVLHPLLHSNTSTLDQHRFSSTFSGTEFFLIDHQRTLPAMAYLEMARVAVAHGRPSLASPVTELSNVEWASAMPVTADRPVHTSLRTGRDGLIHFDIHSEEVTGEGSRAQLVHCRGGARQHDRAVPKALDLERLRATMTEDRVDQPDLEALVEAMIPRRGTTLRALKTIHRGYGQALAHLELPVILEGSREDFVLHPALMDPVVQTAVALGADFAPVPDQSPQLSRLESLRVFSACVSPMFAWVRYSRGSSATNKTASFDVDLMDGEGVIYVEMRSLSLATPEEKRAVAPPGEEFTLLLDKLYPAQPESGEDETADGQFKKILDEIL